MNIPSRLVSRKIGLINDPGNQKIKPLQYQKSTLSRLLHSARDTAFGKYYGFKDLKTKKAFQQNIPLHDYKKIHDGWWKKSLEGRADITWPGTVPYFALSSGTSGAPSKFIPVTKAMQKMMRTASLGILTSINKFDMPMNKLMKQWLMIGGSASLEPHNSSLVGDLSGINGLHPPVWVKHFKKPSLETTMLPTWEARAEHIVENAYRWDISIVSGIPSWVQLILEKVQDRYALDTIRELWPNLSLFVTGGIDLEPYKSNIDQLIGIPMKYIDTYLASEGFFAFQNSPDSRDMNLLFNAGVFYEFIPFTLENFDENGNLKAEATAITIEEVEEDVDYALVISTCAGAWRYVIGDNIKFTDRASGKIRITGRTGHFLSVCGEHVSIENMNAAICKVKERLSIDLREYTVGVIPKNNHFAHEWFIGTDCPTEPALLANLLDQELMKLNDDYRSERGAMLQAPKVNVIPNDWFYKWKQMKGKMNGQSKVPRVVKGEVQVRWNQFIQEHQQITQS